jgi:NAD(P)-dependent dehydrogenase (short-subunit alcohol dehydrogenase family)
MKKNILVTGASGNLGKAVVEKFLKDGYQVLAMTTPGKGLGYEVAGAITTYDADLTDEKSVNETLEKIIGVHKTIDAAILTVGAFALGTIQTTGGADLQKMIALNFNTAYFVARVAFNQMVAQGAGRIIFIGARPALVAAEGKNMVAYALSKSMVFKLSELLNAEAPGKNVVTAVIVPGTIDTPANRQANPKADFTSWVSGEEIAANIQFIISDPARALREPILKLYSNL